MGWLSQTGSFMQSHMVNKKSIEQLVEDTGFDFYTLLCPTFYGQFPGAQGQALRQDP
jgi:hypothetical protein